MSLSDEDRIAELEAERDYWKDQAQKNATTDQVWALRRAFALTPAEAWILAKLYNASGKVVRYERLDEDLPGRNWEERADGSNIIQVYISKIRRKIGHEAIETVRAHGYRIAEAMQTRVAEVLA